ncbi:LysR family transcriptional regulator [Ottowia sp.]|uniref:LysR family transcriptional regulator n=1 Tax=Ottowia sp. TaxID=1898956 RepID=UPI0039E32260
MDLRQLESFVAVADLGGMSRAAVHLQMAQPSVSRQIALLEKELGQRLLERHGRGVKPTEAGRVLAGHARKMLEQARHARDEMQDLGSRVAGRCVIGLPPRLALAHAPSLVMAFRERFPNAAITVLEGLSVSLRESLITGHVDLALLFDPAPTPLLRYEPLLRERLCLVAPAGCQLPAVVGLATLSNYPLILPSEPNSIRRLLERQLRPRGIALQVRAEVGAVQTTLALVASGTGCTLVPQSALRLGPPALRHAPVGPPAIWNRLVLATPVARAATRVIRGAESLLQQLDFTGAAR